MGMAIQRTEAGSKRQEKIFTPLPNPLPQGERGSYKNPSPLTGEGQGEGELFTIHNSLFTDFCDSTSQSCPEVNASSYAPAPQGTGQAEIFALSSALAVGMFGWANKTWYTERVSHANDLMHDRKFDEAAKIYEKAASKVSDEALAKSWWEDAANAWNLHGDKIVKSTPAGSLLPKSAGDAFKRSAELYRDKVKNPSLVTQLILAAAGAYEQSELLPQAIDEYTDASLLFDLDGQKGIAAAHLEKVIELQEKLLNPNYRPSKRPYEILSGVLSIRMEDENFRGEQFSYERIWPDEVRKTYAENLLRLGELQARFATAEGQTVAAATFRKASRNFMVLKFTLGISRPANGGYAAFAAQAALREAECMASISGKTPDAMLALQAGLDALGEEKKFDPEKLPAINASGLNYIVYRFALKANLAALLPLGQDNPNRGELIELINKIVDIYRGAGGDLGYSRALAMLADATHLQTSRTVEDLPENKASADLRWMVGKNIFESVTERPGNWPNPADKLDAERFAIAQLERAARAYSNLGLLGLKAESLSFAAKLQVQIGMFSSAWLTAQEAAENYIQADHPDEAVELVYKVALATANAARDAAGQQKYRKAAELAFATDHLLNTVKSVDHARIGELESLRTANREVTATAVREISALSSASANAEEISRAAEIAGLRALAEHFRTNSGVTNIRELVSRATAMAAKDPKNTREPSEVDLYIALQGEPNSPWRPFLLDIFGERLLSDVNQSALAANYPKDRKWDRRKEAGEKPAVAGAR